MTPHLPGVLLALAAALLFGLTTPLVALLGRELGPFVTSALLYLGAAALAGALRAGVRKGPLTQGHALARRHVATLVLMALVGAALAPVLLVLGLGRTGPTSASLALNAEALFTVLLATRLTHEPWHRDMLLGVLAMLAGGVLLALDAAGTGAASLVGLVLVLGAALAWACDNVLSRAVSEARPVTVVMLKGALGAGVTLTLGSIAGERLPRDREWLLLAVGASGYGASLALYLLAQRRLGAARTGSIFGVAPFIGAVTAFAMGDRDLGTLALLAALCLALGVWLHGREPHEHAHAHAPIEHEHVHRHDDGHHAHAHDPPVDGAHSHRHHHEAVVHRHAHAPDVHHRHRHG